MVYIATLSCILKYVNVQMATKDGIWQEIMLFDALTSAMSNIEEGPHPEKKWWLLSTMKRRVYKITSLIKQLVGISIKIFAH